MDTAGDTPAAPLTSTRGCCDKTTENAASLWTPLSKVLTPGRSVTFCFYGNNNGDRVPNMADTFSVCVCVSVVIKHVSKHVLCIVSVEAAAGIIMNPRKRRIRKGSDYKTDWEESCCTWHPDWLTAQCCIVIDWSGWSLKGGWLHGRAQRGEPRSNPGMMWRWVFSFVVGGCGLGFVWAGFRIWGQLVF